MKELVKKIRDLTGAGFAECKKAVEESNGNLEVALEILKKRGVERASKKVGKEVENGSVTIKKDVDGNVVVVNFRAQTDFAVKSESFCNFVGGEADLWLNSYEEDLTKVVNSAGESFQNRLSMFISILGENVLLNYAKKFNRKPGTKYVSYLHNKVNPAFPDMALFGVLLCFNDEADDSMCLNIAKHVAASDSLFLTENQITEEMVKENPDIKDTVLLNQQFFYDESVTVNEYIQKNSIQILDLHVFYS